MIEKLNYRIEQRRGYSVYAVPSPSELMDKINESIEHINKMEK